MRTRIYLVYILLVSLMVSCELEQLPSDSVSAIQAFSSSKGIEQANIGQYDTFKKAITIRGKNNWQYNIPRAIDLGTLMGDDVFISNSYGDLTSFNQYDTESRLDNGGFNLALWAAYYKNIAVCNKIIAEIEPTNELKALVGESYYLRALWYFSLARVYGKPYTHGRNNLCVPLRIDPNAKTQARATVGEVYDQMILDLDMAASLLPDATVRSRPSKEAAWGLLSRIYVWMADPKDPASSDHLNKAIEYADKVINSGKFPLTGTAAYFGSDKKRPDNLPVGTAINHYYSKAKDEKETLFALGVLSTDIGIAARGAMWMQTFGGIGFGQYNASDYYRNILGNDANDLRSNFIEPRYQLDASGNVKVDAQGKKLLFNHKGYEQYNINKFAYLSGDSQLSDIIFQRSAEVYLNRAEAYAKKALLGDASAIQKTLADVNLVRARAKATSYNSISNFKTIYPSNPGNPVADGVSPNEPDILDVVMTERFLELAWENNRSADIFRNKRNMYRNYPGPHLPKGMIPWNNNERIYAPIPLEETQANPLLKQSY